MPPQILHPGDGPDVNVYRRVELHSDKNMKVITVESE